MTIAVYPRACGGTRSPAFRTLDGLSPRVRGNLQPSGCPSTVLRKGLSPRVRGKPCHRSARRASGAISLCIRSIPARAGEPFACQALTRPVYPRACGGTGYRGHGLSPCGGSVATRSIPARAGEPAACRRRVRGNRTMRMTVYPRACGGTTCGGSHRARVRNPVSAPRSIPARAGEPLPRQGLSPRVRGNPRAAIHFGVYPRACGGTKPASQGRYPATRVYPRACGGTRKQRSGRLCGGSAANGSIPARAGEPRDMNVGPIAVYPRACGGTVQDDTTGLSPRVRGNLVGLSP